MRVQPDVDSRIVQEMNKNDLLTIVGEINDFWVVEAPSNLKAYVFRSFILDNVVEGNRVNVRLEPNLDAPVIAHLNAGDEVDGIVSARNNKWMEISTPAGTRFYVAKQFVEYAGGPEVKVQHENRCAAIEQLFDATSTLSQVEVRKPFEEIDFERVTKGFNTIISSYTDFPEYVEQAKDALALFQEVYLQKQIAFNESKPVEKAPLNEEKIAVEIANVYGQITDKMRMWEPVEESLYLSWQNMNDNRSLSHFYEEQKLTAVAITGILESYNSPVKKQARRFHRERK